MTRYTLIGATLLAMQAAASAQLMPFLAAHPQQSGDHLPPVPPAPPSPHHGPQNPYPPGPPQLQPIPEQGDVPMMEPPMYGVGQLYDGEYGPWPQPSDWPGHGCLWEAPCDAASVCSPPIAMLPSPPAAVTPLAIRGNTYGYAPATPPVSMFSGYSTYSLAYKVWEAHGRELRKGAKHHKSPGNMLPVQPMYPVAHGSYYFRPYNYRLIPYQQAQSLRWSDRVDQPYTGSLMDELTDRASRFQSDLGVGLNAWPHAGAGGPPLPASSVGLPSGMGESSTWKPWTGAAPPSQQFRPVQRGEGF